MHFNKEINIANRRIAKDEKVFIIAEAGVNHGGDISVAKQLVDIAKKAGADAVKFQAFRTKELIIEKVKKAPYQEKTTSSKETQTEMLQRLELSKNHYIELKNYCEEQDIIFLITPFDEFSLKELEEIGVCAYKIASTDTTNIPFLKKVAKTGKPIFLSTGMTFLSELKEVLAEIHPINKDVILMQCTANYPIKDSEANLNVLNTFKENFDILLAYSDHSVGIGAAPYSIPFGVSMIEKHFTISREDDGPDHAASLEADELKQLVSEVRRIEKYLGSYTKEPTVSEQKTRKSLQKCLVAKTEIKIGDVFTEENVVAKRTGGIGISPMKYKTILNKVSEKNYEVNDIIIL